MNQPGKDTSIGQDLRRLYDNTVPSGKILISVAGEAQVGHHLVVPIPKSYEAAMTIALRIVAGNSHTTGIDLSDDFSLKYRMKKPDGSFVWASIIPEFWNEVVKDGDHLRLASTTWEILGGGSPIFGTIFGSSVLSEYVGSKKIVVLLPETYQHTQIMCMAKFDMLDKNVKKVQLFIRIPSNPDSEGWTTIDRDIGEGWSALLTEIKNQYAKVEIWAKCF
ncbi:hypothetical protein GALMADRAFT_258495 [Galerina marginata CBS 339.88]|uniref:Uncharacterized protein n=1 Tax=Galerina marginata (strain CBS 339.88) TaxID=685588 RepID=A0A067S886_GALM3|nr:hypothetical protein GALMADRAFT_258495 [Galerina marginata CBS 339.88]